jgi:hypothetical protein
MLSSTGSLRTRGSRFICNLNLPFLGKKLISFSACKSQIKIGDFLPNRTYKANRFKTAKSEFVHYSRCEFPP